MRQYHMISAKRMGWDQIYDYYLFPTDRYTKKVHWLSFTLLQRKL